MAAIEQSDRKVQQVAKHYAEKYKKANEVLKLHNTEKITLLQEKMGIGEDKNVLK